ncbi:MAG: hypothetical protein KBT27_05360, partial [Prevotellaceae bacterium]|nr:hypothetical protein [Candidatus Faecinaster equi]
MAKAQKFQQYIYKINSSLLAQNNWDLKLDLKDARQIPGMVVSLADSQLLTWINELNHTEDYDAKAKTIRQEIKYKQKEYSAATNSKRKSQIKTDIAQKYQELYNVQFKQDYVCVIMDKISDYDRANKGFYINGIKYKRLICTTNGVKTSTVVYVNEKLWPELTKRINNGRDVSKKLVPAKYGAYESLVASASIPVSWPEPKESKIPGGIIVVSDCIVKFNTDYIEIDDSDPTIEPIVELKRNQEFENNMSDGCSMMLPSLSKRWNGELNGDFERTMSGCNLRCAFTKGMTFTFDFIRFAEEVVGASKEHPERYIIKDFWGHERDIRDAKLILTESQLKLCKSYTSWEDYYNKCLENHYTLRVTKNAEEECDDIRQLNYQFIQSLDLSDDDIQELIAPTVNEIKDIMRLDPRKSIAYLCGSGLNNKTIKFADNCAKALMIDPNLINDPYISGKIAKMINRRIKDAKIGVLDIHGNFQILSGDLYALCEHIFSMTPRGILKAGEIYSKYWYDQGVDRVLCFRAPMSNEHSIVAQNICRDEKALDWFKYIDTCVVVNGWDTMPAALNGFDFDGDLLFTTDNAPLMRCQTNLPALNCIQTNAPKKEVTEDDVIAANKAGFGSEIGSITNKITAMTSLMANYSKDSEEYKTLKYRTQCGQALQQREIDKAKGILPIPMPKKWYNYSANKINSDDLDEIIDEKRFNQSICAGKKPYFFIWNYDSERVKYNQFVEESNAKSEIFHGMPLKELEKCSDLTDDAQSFLRYCQFKNPVDMSPSTMNRICWEIERIFKLGFTIPTNEFDYTVYKSVQDTKDYGYLKIKQVCKNYFKALGQLKAKPISGNAAKKEISASRDGLLDVLKEDLHILCPNNKALCNILLDLCYRDGQKKSLVWDVCGNTIIDNLLEKHNYYLTYPVKS